MAQNPQFGEIQEKGAQYRRWLASPRKPGCRIGRSTVTYSDLSLTYKQDLGQKPASSELDFPEYMKEYIDQRTITESTYKRHVLRSQLLKCIGVTGQGMIMLEIISRNQTQDTTITQGTKDSVLHISTVSQAMYRRDFAIDSLRHVFVNEIYNKNTTKFVLKQLFTSPEAIHDFYSDDQNSNTYSHGSPECDALLGTDIGRVIAHLVLEAFDRGTRRIYQITIYPYNNPWENNIHMRFDIEAI